MLCVFYKKKKIHCLWGVSFRLGACSPVFNSLVSVLGGEHSGPSGCLLSSLRHWDTLFPGGLCFPLFLIFSPVVPSLSPPPPLFQLHGKLIKGLEIWLINLPHISEQGSGCNRCWQMDTQINTQALRWLLSWELRSLEEGTVIPGFVFLMWFSLVPSMERAMQSLLCALNHARPRVVENTIVSSAVFLQTSPLGFLRFDFFFCKRETIVAIAEGKGEG